SKCWSRLRTTQRSPTSTLMPKVIGCTRMTHLTTVNARKRLPLMDSRKAWKFLPDFVQPPRISTIPPLESQNETIRPPPSVPTALYWHRALCSRRQRRACGQVFRQRHHPDPGEGSLLN